VYIHTFSALEISANFWYCNSMTHADMDFVNWHSHS